MRSVSRSSTGRGAGPGARHEAPRYGRVSVKLIGENGNAFAVIGAVAKALPREVDRAAADEWTEAAWGAGSYDELLWLALAWVEVE